MLARYAILGTLILNTAAVACIPIRATIHASPRGQLIEVSPGVWVYEDDADEVFYVEGYYWRRSGDGWRRSSARDRDYNVVEVTAVPNQVRTIPQGRYVHYRRHQETKQDDHRGDHHEGRGEAPHNDPGHSEGH